MVFPQPERSESCREGSHAFQGCAAHRAHRSVRNKFEGLKKSGADRWSALAAGLEVAWGELTA